MNDADQEQNLMDSKSSASELDSTPALQCALLNNFLHLKLVFFFNQSSNIQYSLLIELCAADYFYHIFDHLLKGTLG